jgi:glycosyltransferase involved in cell wall biosynthesis
MAISLSLNSTDRLEGRRGSYAPEPTAFAEIRSNHDVAPCLSVIMPVYNEAATVAQIISLVLSQKPVVELIVVDDGSTDNTAMVLKTLQQALYSDDSRLKIIFSSKNQGKGAALRAGIAQAKAPILVIQDADLEYDPREYYLLLKPILADVADVVFGSRFLGGGPHRVLYFWHSLGNRLITLISNMVTNLNLSDMETCYKVFRREIIQRISLQENRFGFEAEITAKVTRIPRVRIYEVPISYYGRTYAEGKKIGWRDGVRALWCTLKYSLPLRRG